MHLLPCLRCSTPIPSALESCPCCGAALNSGAGETVRPASVLLMGLSLMACNDKLLLQPEYGVAITLDTGHVDDDEDGYAEVDGDCDDSNPDIHPEAVETPGDGIDSNCDGADDT
jgi:hypothetical protein